MYELSHDYEVWDMIENLQHSGRKDGTASVNDVLDYEQDQKIKRLLNERKQRAQEEFWARQQEQFKAWLDSSHAGLS